jgi:hypothetical protein
LTAGSDEPLDQRVQDAVRRTPRPNSWSSCRIGSGAAARYPFADKEQLILTLNAATHEGIEIEKLDQAGHCHQLSDNEVAGLTSEDDIEELLCVVQDAYEAGVA